MKKNIPRDFLLRFSSGHSAFPSPPPSREENSKAVKFMCHARQALRLKSDQGANGSEVVELRAHGGWLSMLNTEVR